MFSYSFLDYIQYELMVNHKINQILEIRKTNNTDLEKLSKIGGLIKSIVGGYFKSAGLSATFIKLATANEAEKQRLNDFQKSSQACAQSFFSQKGRLNEGYDYYLELLDHINRFSRILITSPDEALSARRISSLLVSSGITSSMHSTIRQIYSYIENNFYPPLGYLMDFHEYLGEMEMSIERAGRVDLLQFLRRLETHLSQYSIPVKGDTHFKKTALETIAEIVKIRNKLCADEETMFQVEIQKIRAMLDYMLVKEVGVNQIVEAYQPVVTESVRKIEDKDFQRGWFYVNDNGFLSQYSGLLSDLQSKILFLKKILVNQAQFDAVVAMIEDVRAASQDTNSPFILKRYVSAGEFESLKTNRCFTQNIHYSTSENAKWFFYGKGNPGVTNDYLCEVMCAPKTAEIIESFNDFPAAILVKENEPDCVGIHEQVLANFNLLISSIKITHVQSKKIIEIIPDQRENILQKLTLSTSIDEKSSQCFSIN